MFYLLSLIWILSISGLLVIVLKKKFGFICTITFLLGSLLLYLFGFINQIKLGFYTSWLFVLLFWLVIIKWIIKKETNKLNVFKENYLTTGLVAFVILCIYAFVLYKLQGFTYCDEFTHWGPMVIATIKANGFYAVPNSLLTFHKDYPPLFSLLEVLWCGFDGFHFSETYCYIALTVFMFSCFLPIFDKLNIKNKKDWIKSLIAIIAIVFVGITLSKTETAQEFAYVYNSIYIDWPLALFTAFSIFVIYKEKEWDIYGYVFLTIALSSMLVMKQMGICFYLIVLFYAFIKITFVNKKLNSKRLIKGILCFVVVPFAFYFSWKFIINLYDIHGQFVLSELKFSDVIDIAKGNTELSWKHEAYWNYIQAIINRPLILHPFKMSYFVYVAIVLLAVVLLFRFKKDGLLISLTYLIGACGYALTMLLLYMLAFDIYEAPRLASFDRYMSSYLYIGTTLLLMLVFDKLNELKGKKTIYKYSLTIIVLLLLVEPGSIKTIIPKFKITDESKKVLVVMQFNPFEPKREELNGLRFEFTNNGYMNKDNMPYEKWYLLINTHDLMYVVGYDDYVYNELWLPLKQDVYLWNDSLYEIFKENNIISMDYKYEQYYDYVLRYYLMEK